MMSLGETALGLQHRLYETIGLSSLVGFIGLSRRGEIPLGFRAGLDCGGRLHRVVIHTLNRMLTGRLHGETRLLYPCGPMPL
jgi:hypothetical protein